MAEDTRTLEVEGFFGKKKQITKADFIQRWVDHARQLMHIGINVEEQVREAAAADFEDTWKRQNKSAVDHEVDFQYHRIGRD